MAEPKFENQHPTLHTVKVTAAAILADITDLAPAPTADAPANRSRCRRSARSLWRLHATAKTLRARTNRVICPPSFSTMIMVEKHGGQRMRKESLPGPSPGSRSAEQEKAWERG